MVLGIVGGVFSAPPTIPMQEVPNEKATSDTFFLESSLHWSTDKQKN
jgi:hypothetical protein